MSRTNIVLDDTLVEKGLKLSGLKTKRQLVDTALREFIRLESQKRTLSLQGKIQWEGDLN